MSDVLWRRLPYMLSPQLDIYHHLGPKLRYREVLEVGFGTGAGTLQLVPYAAHVTAIEKHPEAFKFAERMWPAQAIWLRADILEFARVAVFDAVVMIEVLEHIGEYELALENVARALKAGGVLYISARNANADLRHNDLHEREWTAGEFRAALEKHFAKVELWDYTLSQLQTDDTRMTPLIAAAHK